MSSCQMLDKFNGWIKYIEGFMKGIEASKEVKIETFNTCINEIFEGMTQTRNELNAILEHCNDILIKEEELTSLLNQTENDLKLKTEEVDRLNTELTNLRNDFNNLMNGENNGQNM